MASSVTYLDLALGHVLGLWEGISGRPFGAAKGQVLTKLLTMILLSPGGLEALPDEGLAAAPRAGLVFFLTPPTGAAAAGRAVLRVERRPPARAPLLVERISSRDWSSLPDMLMLVVKSVEKIS